MIFWSKMSIINLIYLLTSSMADILVKKYQLLMPNIHVSRFQIWRFSFWRASLAINFSREAGLWLLLSNINKIQEGQQHRVLEGAIRRWRSYACILILHFCIVHCPPIAIYFSLVEVAKNIDVIPWMNLQKFSAGVIIWLSIDRRPNIHLKCK